MRTPEPVPAAALAEAGRGFVELHTDGSEVYWLEQRPADGRTVLLAADGCRELTPAPWSVGTLVHEYGGASVLVDEGVPYFVAATDQRIYQIPPGAEPRPLTPPDARRYADLAPDRRRDRLIAVCEDHRGPDPLPLNTVVAVPLDGGEPVELCAGHDFYLAPRVSPAGDRLAWQCWDLPRMPWDGTLLYVAGLDADGRPGPAVLVAGGDTESVCHPRWAPDGTLYFVSDRDGWWNLYAWDGTEVRPVAPMAAEVGAAGAMGLVPYDVSATEVVAAVRDGGRARLVRINRSDGEVTELPTDCWEVSQPRFAGSDVVFLGGSPVRPVGVWRWHPARCHELRAGSAVAIDARLLGLPEVLAVPAPDGGVLHALHYPPCPIRTDDPPPLVVIAHGGPVKAATAALSLGVMALMAAVFWTSRGYAVLDVNYRGSTGYGRPYRTALHGRWGELDVADCVTAAEYLVDRGAADPGRIVLRGWSAGGFTTLSGLADTAAFAAGTAYFPVADLEAVHQVTHKYEAGYDHYLIGDWHTLRQSYRDRSPINKIAGITAPLLVVQGTDDPICPPDQTERMVDELRALGRDVRYVSWPGEGHGFERAEHIARSLELEAAFYTRVLSGDRADAPKPAGG
ncbi:S9 family peptidase [Amycolatopsis sp. CA-230715]|uniref:S9 family peptidase n=1 Tax=Amycolatopsis sp. CA-230715 TaxID=2745196 RepID=UPI001C02198C|nr:prolyl oligopeptidase family serine peptidase [Amycolatopsis sp. CA-230715]QWF83534.1 hypothetical protein HUW46_06975 [Amycolatopsis sp. CA-230715]